MFYATHITDAFSILFLQLLFGGVMKLIRGTRLLSFPESGISMYDELKHGMHCYLQLSLADEDIAMLRARIIFSASDPEQEDISVELNPLLPNCVIPEYITKGGTLDEISNALAEISRLEIAENRGVIYCNLTVPGADAVSGSCDSLQLQKWFRKRRRVPAA